MMAGLIDTNLLLFAANSDCDEFAAAADFLGAAGRSTDTWYLTEGIVYEFLRVATHPRVFPNPLTVDQALGFLEPFVTGPAFSFLIATDRHWDLLTQEVRGRPRRSGNLFFDIRTVVLMKEHGVRRIYTADTDFLQFDGIEVVDPVGGTR